MQQADHHQQNVGCLQVKMNDVLVMEVEEAASNIQCNLVSPAVTRFEDVGPENVVLGRNLLAGWSLFNFAAFCGHRHQEDTGPAIASRQVETLKDQANLNSVCSSGGMQSIILKD